MCPPNQELSQHCLPSLAPIVSMYPPIIFSHITWILRWAGDTEGVPGAPLAKMDVAIETQEVLMQLVQATQMVATRTSLVHVGAPSHLGQLLPTALQLWSQDRLSQQGKGLESTEASSCLRSLRSSYSEELRDTAVKLAADASLSAIPSQPALQDNDSAPGEPVPTAGHDVEQGVYTSADEGSARREGCPGTCKQRAHHARLRSLQGSGEAVCNQSGSSATGQGSSDAHRARQQSAAALPKMSSEEFLTIEEDDRGAASGTATPQQASLAHMSAAGQQLLLLLRVLRNLCATGSDATRAMADVGVPAQVARLISDPMQSNQQGDMQRTLSCAGIAHPDVNNVPTVACQGTCS